MIFNMLITLVHINGITQGLKGEKGNTNRKQYIICRYFIENIELIEKDINGFAKKVKIFIEKKYTKTYQQAGCKKKYFKAFSPGSSDSNSAQVIYNGGDENQHHILVIPAHVKIIAGNDQKHPTEAVGQHKIECHHHGKKYNKIQ